MSNGPTALNTNIESGLGYILGFMFGTVTILFFFIRLVYWGYWKISLSEDT